MDKGYIELFKQIARSMELTAEQSMDDPTHRESGQKMRDDYIALRDKLDNGTTLTIADYVKLYLGAQIVVKQLDTNIRVWRKTAQNYQESVIPSLKEVIDAKEKFWTVAEEKFKSVD